LCFIAGASEHRVICGASLVFAVLMTLYKRMGSFPEY
jgi:hypothetical protein